MKKKFLLFDKIIFHPDPLRRLTISLLYCGFGLFANFFLFQVFCVPVLSVAIPAGLFFITILFFPFCRNERLRQLCYFLIGIGFPICIYGIWFLMDPWDNNYPLLSYLGEYLLWSLFFGLGLLAYIPLYLLYHIYRYFKIADARNKLVVIAGATVPLIITAIYLLVFRITYNAFETAYHTTGETEDNIAKLPSNYFTERILGIGFKYHTQLEYVYDGWRPPLHDPFFEYRFMVVWRLILSFLSIR